VPEVQNFNITTTTMVVVVVVVVVYLPPGTMTIYSYNIT
jgi:hypothetical protein